MPSTMDNYKCATFVCLLIIAPIAAIASCRMENKDIHMTSLWSCADKLTTMNITSKAEADKQLGISLKHVDNANKLFSFHEYQGELPGFYGSTKAEYVTGNNNKESWLIAIDFKLPICVDWKTVQNKYLGGEYILASPSNLSPNAANGYETHLNSGTLSFAFNVKSGCLTQMRSIGLSRRE